MREVSRSWDEIKAILNANNLYFDYSDTSERRSIFVVKSAVVTFKTSFPINQEPENPENDSWKTPEQKDFDDNWAEKAGDKKYVYYSQSFNVTSSTEVFSFKIKANDETTDVEAFVYKGLISVDENAQRGDTIEVAVADEDNILGYGAGLVLGYMIRKKILHGGKQDHFINPPKYDFLSSKRKIMAGLYVRVTYSGSGRPNVICDCEYEY